MTAAEQKILAQVNKLQAGGRTGEVLWRVRGRGIDVTHGDPARPFFIASATKLYVTAILAQLRGEGRLDWDAPLALCLPDLDLSWLPATATVRAVMGHTAGLADYFEGRRADGGSTFQRAVAGDFAWTLADVLAWTQPMKAPAAGRALYSDTGYQLLGALIERLTGEAFAQSVQHRVAQPLGLRDTYCFGLEDLPRYDAIATMQNGATPLRIPLAMASVQADGGVVSTLDDGVAFLDAFFGGRLFDPSLLAELETGWHGIFYPLEYGTGIMRFQMSPLFTGFRRLPPFVGHSGASGTVMFRCRDLDLTVVGTVNQVQQRSLPYRLMVHAAMATRG
jgi:D-alanyl-D-alanine carboxypeptidase